MRGEGRIKSSVSVRAIGAAEEVSMGKGISADFLAWCWLNEDAVEAVDGRATSSSRISSSLLNPRVIRSRNAASSISSSIISGRIIVSRLEGAPYEEIDGLEGICSNEPRLPSLLCVRLKLPS